MSMTENNYDKLKDAICELVNLAEDATSREVFEMLDNAGADVIDCLDKLSGYEAIGTIEDFKALKEKKSDWKYSRKENIATCKNCSYEHYLGTYHQYATKYCPNCGCEMTN